MCIYWKGQEYGAMQMNMLVGEEALWSPTAVTVPIFTTSICWSESFFFWNNLILLNGTAELIYQRMHPQHISVATMSKWLFYFWPGMSSASHLGSVLVYWINFLLLSAAQSMQCTISMTDARCKTRSAPRVTFLHGLKSSSETGVAFWFQYPFGYVKRILTPCD